MKQRIRQKLQLIINIVLTVLSLSALVISMVAWFSNNRYAQIQSLNMHVDQKEFNMVSYPSSIILPCATKLDDVSNDDFNNSCCVVAKYELKGEVSAVVGIKNDDGLLGYVWNEDIDGVMDVDQNGVIDDIDFYGKISEKVSEQLSGSPYSYDDLKHALTKLNRRSVGRVNKNGNTDIYIVFWGDYNKLCDQLNETNDDGDYVFTGIRLDAELSFVL